MARKQIPDGIQNSVLLKSRRRCCLCFWLEGVDEVQKGQIAHLDGNPDNNDEGNLAFLCFDHHDDYDGTTSLAKGLREDEVCHWRDELYKEMEYRFRSLRRKSLELVALGVVYVGPKDHCRVRFRLKNTGEAAIRSPVVSVRLPENIGGDAARGVVAGGGFETPELPVLTWMHEERQDLFEPNGRVGVAEPLGHANPVLLPDHCVQFDGLSFHLRDLAASEEVELQYRLDAEDVQPKAGTLQFKVPTSPEELLHDP